MGRLFASTSVIAPVLVAVSALLASCQNGPGSAPSVYNPSDPQSRPDSAKIDTCTGSGQPGCPCDETGAVVECGKVIERSGDYVTCSMGRTTCIGQSGQSQTWGECLGDHIVAQSVPGLALAGGRRILSTKTSCANVCDPNACSSLVNSSSDVDAGGFNLTEAGVSLGAADAAAGSGPCNGLWCQIQSCDG